MSIANIVIGPVIIAIIFGFIVGSRVHLNLDNSFKFTASGILALIIGALIMAYGLGQFPGYNDVPIATTFLGHWRIDRQCITRRTSERRSLVMGFLMVLLII